MPNKLIKPFGRIKEICSRTRPEMSEKKAREVTKSSSTAFNLVKNSLVSLLEEECPKKKENTLAQELKELRAAGVNIAKNNEELAAKNQRISKARKSKWDMVGALKTSGA